MNTDTLCSICNHTQMKFRFHKNEVPIYQCSKCRVGIAQISEFDVNEYYNASYFNGGRADGYSNYIETSDVLHHQFRGDLDLLKKLGAQGGHLLELGCAYGFFLDEAKKAAYQVSGLELCEDAVKSCRERGLNNVRHGVVSAQALSYYEDADVVVMLDVIEHLADPCNSLEMAAKKLKPNGLLLLTTGDFSSLIARIFGKNWRLMTPPQHLWFFTPTSLNLICEKYGMELIYLDHPSKKVPIGLIAYQMLRYFMKPPSLPSWAHHVGININLFDAMRIVFKKRVDR